MSCYVCKNCGTAVAVDVNTQKSFFFNYQETSTVECKLTDTKYRVTLEKCPHCKFMAVRLSGVSDDVADIDRWVVPPAVMRHFPEYVPAAILADYEEACAIIQDSPKSAATLSRRCLEGILQDFFGIKERNLHASLEKVKPLLSNSLGKAVDALRKVGNVGAHMQSDVNTLLDVDPGEAALLIKLIERLIDGTYVARHDDDALFTAVCALADC